MALITLGQLETLWQNVSDWVTGASSSSPKVTMNGRLDKLDSTVTALGSNGFYSPTTNYSLTNYDKIVGTVYTDQPSTLKIQQSWDGTNWDVESDISVGVNTPTAFAIDVVAPYGKITLTNGATAQTVLRMYVGGKVL